MKKNIIISALLSIALFSMFSFASLKVSREQDERANSKSEFKSDLSREDVEIVRKAHWENI